MPKVDIAVVGAGPAGVAAAAQCKRLGLSVLLLDKTGEVGGLVKEANRIENYPGMSPMSGTDFVRLLGNHLTRFGLSVQKRRVVAVSATFEGFLLATDGGDIEARTVAVAVGTRPKRIHIPGSETVCYSPLDAASENGNEAVVIGGGEAALDYALSLAAKGISSTILVRGSALRAYGILPAMIHQDDRIRIQLNAEPKEISKTNAGILVTFKDAALKALSAHHVLAAVGREPCIDNMVNGLDLGSMNTVATNVPGLFVIGDARTGTLGQIGTAVGDGLSAAAPAAKIVFRTKTDCDSF
jgi:thioredoxin reductase (NADPH)